MDDQRDIDREHLALRNEISLIRRLLDETDPRSLLIQRVSMILDLLQRHVAREDLDVNLDRIAARSPEAAARAAALRDEHRTLLAAGERLREQLEAAGSLPIAVLRLLDQLGRHELAEHELLRSTAAFTAAAEPEGSG